MGFEEELAEFEPWFVLSKRKRFPTTMLLVVGAEVEAEKIEMKLEEKLAGFEPWSSLAERIEM